MTILRVGSTDKYAQNWDQIFGAGKKGGTSKGTKSPAPTSPRVAKKKGASPPVKKTPVTKGVKKKAKK